MYFFYKQSNKIYIQTPQAPHEFHISRLSNYELIGFTDVALSQLEKQFQESFDKKAITKQIYYGENNESYMIVDMWEIDNSEQIKKLEYFLNAHEDVTPQIQIKSLMNYLPLLEKMSRVNLSSNATDIMATMFYRGQSKAEWKLIPSLFRKQNNSGEIILGDYNVFLNQALDIILETFSKRVQPYLDFQLDNVQDLLAIGQHNGLPTNLLDWTTNPLIAAYFACNESPEDDGAIWVVRKGRDSLYEAVDDENGKLFRPKVVSRYIEAQKGWFSLHQPPKNYVTFKSIDEDNYPSNWLSLVKIHIPHHLKYSILRELNSVGVNEASVFPSLRGVARDISNEIRPPTTEY